MSERLPELDNGSNELHQYVTTLRLHKWLIAAVVALILGAVMVRSYLQTPTYQSQARVLVRPVSTLFAGVFNMQTESQLVGTEQVAELVAESTDYQGDPTSLLGGVTVAVSTDTEILVINYVSEDPQVAQERAQGFAEGFLEYREGQFRQDILTQTEQLVGQIDSLNERINSLTEEIRDTRSAAARANIQTQINSLVSQLALLEQHRAQLLSPTDIDVGQVVQPAGLPSAPFSPNYTQNAILGLFLGLVAGVAAALLRERLDDRLRGRHDLEARLGHPVLAVIPRWTPWRRSKEARVVTLEEPHSVAAEAYKTLRTGVLFLAAQRDAKLLLVSGPHAGEGKTATLANLAVALAHADRRVIAVSADLRRGRLHDFFHLSNATGVTTVLAGQSQLHEVLHRVGVDNLRVLPSGPPPLNPAEVLGSEAMGELLFVLREMADVVLVDAPPILGVADATILSPVTDGVIVVADIDRSNRSSILHAVQQLDQVNAQIIGGVLNNFELTKNLPYGYYESHAAPLTDEASLASAGDGVLSRLRKVGRS